MSEPPPADVPVSPPPAVPEPIPSAGLALRQSRLGWYLLLPLLAVVVVAIVLGLAWSNRGTTIRLSFKEGHGLKPGDAVRCRGIIVGEVRRVVYDSDTGGVKVEAELQPEASELARTGSQFWIARPLADFASGVRGLDTVVGAKYIVVQPGDGDFQTNFMGLEAPPIPETIEPSGLRVTLQAHNLGGLRPGAPVTFRQVRVGSVLSTALASDASAVDVHIYIRPIFAPLVRKNTEFWNVSGMRLQAGWRSGFAFSLESLEAVLSGGVALATPPPPGKAVVSGMRFLLQPEEPEKWQQWDPALPLTNAQLPKDAIMPRPVPALLRYQIPGWVWNSRVDRRGLVVPVGRDLLGPSDLLTVPPKSTGDLSLVLRPSVTLKAEPAPREPTILRLVNALDRAEEQAPKLRAPGGPEECLLVGPGGEWQPISVARLTEKDGRWKIDAEQFRNKWGAEWHGAAVVAVKGGEVIGLLMVPERRKELPFVLPLDKKMAQQP